MKNSLIISLFFICGILAGKYLNLINQKAAGNYMEWSLYALMLFVGLSFGSDPRLKKIIKSFNLKLLVLPLLTITGTLTGILVYVLIFRGIPARDSFAIASGFGYYSLSGIIISNFSTGEIATIALISNVFREVLTLLLTPVICRYFGSIAPICSAGATSMDTTLPVIVKYSGKNLLLASLFHGIFLTLLVPFLIILIYKVF